MNAKILTTKQVAERLSVSTRTLARWRARNIGPRFFVVGSKTIRYPAQEVEKFEKGQINGRNT